MRGERLALYSVVVVKILNNYIPFKFNYFLIKHFNSFPVVSEVLVKRLKVIYLFTFQILNIPFSFKLKYIKFYNIHTYPFFNLKHYKENLQPSQIESRIFIQYFSPKNFYNIKNAHKIFEDNLCFNSSYYISRYYNNY